MGRGQADIQHTNQAQKRNGSAVLRNRRGLGSIKADVATLMGSVQDFPDYTEEVLYYYGRGTEIEFSQEEISELEKVLGLLPGLNRNFDSPSTYRKVVAAAVWLRSEFLVPYEDETYEHPNSEEHAAKTWSFVGALKEYNKKLSTREKLSIDRLIRNLLKTLQVETQLAANADLVESVASHNRVKGQIRTPLEVWYNTNPTHHYIRADDTQLTVCGMKTELDVGIAARITGSRTRHTVISRNLICKKCLKSNIPVLLRGHDAQAIIKEATRTGSYLMNGRLYIADSTTSWEEIAVTAKAHYLADISRLWNEHLKTNKR